MSSITTTSVAILSTMEQLRGASISAQDQEAILSCCESKAYKEGDEVFREGRICTQLFFICTGILRILSTNEKGTDRTHYFYREGQFCTILKSFNEGVVAEAGIQAACDTEVLIISRRKLEGLYVSLPYIKDIMDRMFQRQLLEKVETRNAYVGADAETQYKLFITLHPEIALRVSMKDIASYLGITPQSLSRIRRNIH